LQRLAQVMARRGEKTALGQIRSIRRFARLLCNLACFEQRRLHELAVGYIAYGGRDQDPITVREGAQADFDGKFCTILPQSEQIQAGAHGTEPVFRGEMLTMGGVVEAEALRYEQLDALAASFLLRIAEQHRKLLIRI